MLYSLSQYLPGKIGFIIRRIILRKKLRKCGNGLSIAAGVEVLGRENIEFGNNISIGQRSYLHAHQNGEIVIGDNFSMNTNSSIGAAEGGKIFIGDNVLIAQNVVIRASNHSFKRTDLPINQQGHESGTITIEDDCWIGANVVVTADVRIGAHSIIGAGAVVTSNVDPFSIVAGVPAKLIRKRN